MGPPVDCDEADKSKKTDALGEHPLASGNVDEFAVDVFAEFHFVTLWSIWTIICGCNYALLVRCSKVEILCKLHK